MSVVHAVVDAQGRNAALKWGRWRDRDVQARFEREAEALKAIGPPTAPAYIDHGVIDQWPYILMEEVPGETLAAWMARSTPNIAALNEVIAILTRIAESLVVIHAAGLVHRDLKPENILLSAKHARILDYGLAKSETGVVSGSVTQIGAIVGTVHYLAPEQLAGVAAVDHRADLYSLGVIAYEILAGQPPFVGERRAIEYQHRVVKPAPLDDVRAVAKELEDLVMALLAKQPEARPQSAKDVVNALANAAMWIETVKGVGGRQPKSVGNTEQVVLVWIAGDELMAITKTVAQLHGIVVRSRDTDVLAAFASQHHDAPATVAVSACRELEQQRCRCVIHVTRALVRRSAEGKLAFYGEELEDLDRWLPSVPFTGTLLTEAAAKLVPGRTLPAPSVGPGFRELERTRVGELQTEPPFVGRDPLIRDIVAGIRFAPLMVALSGSDGIGKTRVLDVLIEQLRSTGRDVIAVKGRRRFFGDRADDERLIEALGGGHDIADALVQAGARGVVVAIDDVDLFSRTVQQAVVREDLRVTRIVTSHTDLLEVGMDSRGRLAIQLQPLDSSSAESLLRVLLRPARLIPDVLIDRLVIRASGNPRLLLALVEDLIRRGGIRRDPGSDEWYVAIDEIDTLLAAPSDAWFATRALEMLPSELARVVQACCVLGPRFSREEVEAALNTPNVEAALGRLVHDRILIERNGWYEMAEPHEQDAIYGSLDDRAALHQRVLRYWLAHRSPNLVGWLARLAHHATGANDRATATTCWLALARLARRRRDEETAVELEARAFAGIAKDVPSELADALRVLDEPV